MNYDGKHYHYGHLLYAEQYVNSSHNPEIGEVTCPRSHDFSGRKEFKPMSNSFLSSRALCFFICNK